MQILEHEGEGRGGVGHGVGAVKDNEAVVVVVVVGDAPGNVCPVVRVHVGGVDRRMELDVVDDVVQHLDLGDILDEMSEVEGLEGLGLRVFNHTDGSAGIDYEDAWFHTRTRRFGMGVRNYFT